jgi:hypothetical protein
MSYSNKFLGSANDKFVNNGTMDININSLQIQNLSPDQLVATDANNNLISVKYPTNTETPVFSASDNSFNTYDAGSFSLILPATLINKYFTFDNFAITVEITGIYIISFFATIYKTQSTRALAIYYTVNGDILPNNPSYADSGRESSGACSSTTVIALNAGDRINLMYQSEYQFSVVNSNLLITSYFIPKVSLQSTLQSQIDTINQNNIVLQNQVSTLSTKLNSLTAFLNLTFGQNF